MKLTKKLRAQLSTTALAAAALLLPTTLRAADHGDAPALAQDQGADIADLFLFMDPNTGVTGEIGKSDVVLIATFHGFITPGEAVNFGVFDPNIRYHFEIFNDHVNLDPGPLIPATPAEKIAKARYLAKVKANRTIDVTFSPRQALNDATGTPPNSMLPDAVKRPSPQTATVTLGGFTGVLNRGVFKTVDGSTPAAPLPILTTPPSLTTAAPQVTNTITVKTGTSIKVFAGIVDDPFFFDIPAFAAFIESVRKGAPTTAGFSRGRDTFAGYNCLCIAISIPKALLTNSDAAKTIIGADFMTQRKSTVLTNVNGGTGIGAFKTVDRIGNPGVNVAFVPFNQKNTYNGGTAKLDASLKYIGTPARGRIAAVPGIVDVLTLLGVTSDKVGFEILADIALAHGDILQLDTNIANAGNNGGTNAGVGFGTFFGKGASAALGTPGGGGRRLADDTIDTVLSVVAGGTLTDNTPNDQDGFAPQNNFPFVHEPHQPLANGVLDDGTRN